MSDEFEAWTDPESTSHGESQTDRRRTSTRPATRPHLLRQTEGPGAPREIQLDGSELLIGRSLGVDIHLDAPEVSRTHAKIFRHGFEFAVRDLGSRNGIQLNGMKVSSAVLRDGDLVRIGPAVFMYLEGG